MKKIITILILISICLSLAGCVEVVSEKPIDAEYVAPYDAMETVYTYKYDWWHGDLKYLPELKMVHHEEEYKVQYEQVWSDNSIETYWKSVSKEEYEDALKKIKKGGVE